MRLRLAQLDDARREFIANASHELRTPLFSLGGLPRAARRRGARRADAARVPRDDARAGGAADEARHRPARPLAARRGPPARRAREPVDLARARAAARATSSRPSRLRAATRSPSGPTARRSRSPTSSACSRSAAILVENALVHTPAGTPVACGRCDARTDSAVLEVEDDGAGDPGGAAAHVFERFYRVDGTARLRQRPRARDRARARGADGRRRSSSTRGPGGPCSRSSLPRAAPRRRRRRFHVKTSRPPSRGHSCTCDGCANRRYVAPALAPLVLGGARRRSVVGAARRLDGLGLGDDGLRRHRTETVGQPRRRAAVRAGRRRRSRRQRLRPGAIYAQPLAPASSRSTRTSAPTPDDRDAGARARASSSRRTATSSRTRT